jgi:hypothetical protein
MSAPQGTQQLAQRTLNGGLPAKRSPLAITGAVLIYLLGSILVFSSILKFAAIPAVVHQMAAAGFAGSKLTMLAALEFACAALFLWHRTRPFGVLLISAYLGGAICTHIAASEYTHAVPPSILLFLGWSGAAILYRQILRSINL